MKFIMGSDDKVIPDGEYIVVLDNLKENNTFKRAALEFHFRVAEGDHKGVLVKGFCNADYKTFSGRTKLTQWYLLVAGLAEVIPGEPIDVNDFFDKVLRVRVEKKVSRKTKNEFSNVIDILELVRCL